MTSVSLIGASVALIVFLGVISIYLAFRSLFAASAPTSDINIYIAGQKPVPRGRVANTPFRVETYDAARLSTDLIDEDVIRAVKKQAKHDSHGKKSSKKTGS